MGWLGSFFHLCCSSDSDLHISYTQSHIFLQPPRKEVTAILPLFRVNAHARPTVGTHTATHDGVYEIIFDNAYSRYYKMSVY